MEQPLPEGSDEAFHLRSDGLRTFLSGGMLITRASYSREITFLVSTLAVHCIDFSSNIQGLLAGRGVQCA